MYAWRKRTYLKTPLIGWLGVSTEIPEDLLGRMSAEEWLKANQVKPAKISGLKRIAFRKCQATEPQAGSAARSPGESTPMHRCVCDTCRSERTWRQPRPSSPTSASTDSNWDPSARAREWDPARTRVRGVNRGTTPHPHGNRIDAAANGSGGAFARVRTQGCGWRKMFVRRVTARRLQAASQIHHTEYRRQFGIG
jgi:hypothetical protein